MKKIAIHKYGLSVLAIFIFTWLLPGIVSPVFGEGEILPSFGNGAIKVVLYADYFCPPCRGIEPQLEPLITDLMKTGKINLIFVDTPTSLDFHGTGNDLTRGDTSLHRPCARPPSYMCTLEISSTDK